MHVDSHVPVMTSYHAWMTSHFKMSALDPPSWIILDFKTFSEMAEHLQNIVDIEIENLENKTIAWMLFDLKKSSKPARAPYPPPSPRLNRVKVLQKLREVYYTFEI